MADDIKKVPVTSSQAGTTTPSTPPPSSPELDEYLDVQNEMLARFQLLPEDMKKFMLDNDGYQRTLYTIAQSQKLTYEELTILETDMSMSMLGMTPPEILRDELQVDLKKNDPEIDAIMKELDEKIIGPIRASYQKIYSVKREAADFLPADPNAVPTTPTPAKVATPISPATPLASSPTTVKPVTPISIPTPVATNMAFATPKPITPMAQPVVSMPGLTSQEKSALEKTGVIISETPAPAPSAPISSRSDLLKSIENPTKAPSASLVADKLKTMAPTVAPAKTTDYTISKPVTPTPTPTIPAKPAGPDPYREPVN